MELMDSEEKGVKNKHQFQDNNSGNSFHFENLYSIRIFMRRHFTPLASLLLK
jgi:hypothetical protein